MTDPSPNYKILHIEPSEYTPLQASSSGMDMSVLRFQIFHLLRRCIPPREIRRSYSHNLPRLNRITTPVKEIKTSVLLQGNSDQEDARDMSRTLSSLEIPENSHAEIIERISQVARQQQKYLTTPKSVNLDVKIGGITTERICYNLDVADYHETNRMVREAIIETEEEEEVLETVQTSKSCIEALEKVRLGGMEEVKQRCSCSICLMEFRDLEVTRLPCSHVYQLDCIVKWLETSHMCPLCRYPMPLGSGSTAA